MSRPLWNPRKISIEPEVRKVSCLGLENGGTSDTSDHLLVQGF